MLKANGLLTHRGRSKAREVGRPRAYEATRPRQLFSWDITYLKSDIQGRYFYLYMFLDVFSRKVVGWEVHEQESADHSSRLLEKICRTEGVRRHHLTVHADNGGPMKGATMLVTMQKLWIVPSFSRPSVSNDNSYSESLFKTLKYCPQYPSKPFASTKLARCWVSEFVAWYNDEHLHSAISFTTPSSRHAGEDSTILLKRMETYRVAREQHPARWSRHTRQWKKVESVRLNWLKKDETSDSNENIRSVS